MSLKKKTIISTVLLFVCMFVLMDIVSRELLLRGAEALERIVAETHINEINYIINQEAERIQQRSRDWGAWDDTLKFVEGRFPEYEKLYIDDKTFEDRKVDVIAYFDKAGKLKYARAYELDTGKWSEAPKDLETIVAARGLLAKNEKGGAKGIITVGGRLMAAGTWPILNSAGKGPLHGTVFMGRWFSPKSTKEIFGILPQVVTVQLMTLAEADSNPGAADALADMERQSGLPRLKIVSTDPPQIKIATKRKKGELNLSLHAKDGMNLAIYFVLGDPAGRPEAVVKTVMPRVFYLQEHVTIVFFQIFIIVVGALFLVMAIVLQQKTVVRRVKQMSDTMKEVEDSRDLSVRVPVRGRDELSRLAAGFNNMLKEMAKVERGQREALRFRQSLIDAIPLPVFYKDLNGRYIGCNAAMEKLLCLRRSEIIGKTIREIAPSGMADISEENDAKLMRSGGIQTLESSMVMPDGVFRDIITYKAVFEDEDGDVSGLIGTIIDITERKQAENRIRESEEKFRMLFAEMISGCALHEVLFDENGEPYDSIILDVNPRFEELTGVMREDIVGKRFSTIAKNTDLFMKVKAKKVLETGEPEHFEYFFSENGSYVDFSMFRPQEGRIAVTFMDITKRKKAEAKLIESEERLKLALMGADLGLWDWEVGIDRSVHNERWASMLGYTFDELKQMDRPWHQLLHPEDLPRVTEAMNEHMEGRAPIYEAEYRMKAKNGEYRWVMAKGKVVERDADGKPQRVVGTHLDVTDHRRADEELEKYHQHLESMVTERTAELRDAVARLETEIAERRRAEEALLRSEKYSTVARLSMGLSHEIKNPVAIIQTHVDVLRENECVDTNEEAAECLDVIMEQTDRILSTLGNLSMLSKGQSFNPSRMSLNDLVDMCVRMCQPGFKKTGVSIRHNLDAVGEIEMTADGGRLLQLLSNLLFNAAESMSGGGEIDVEIKPDNEAGRVELTVGDHGCGIPEENLQRILDPFYTTKPRGFGMGLSICQRIIEEHNGEMFIDSTPGEGTTVRVVLPIENNEQAE